MSRKKTSVEYYQKGYGWYINCDNDAIEALQAIFDECYSYFMYVGDKVEGSEEINGDFKFFAFSKEESTPDVPFDGSKYVKLYGIYHNAGELLNDVKAYVEHRQKKITLKGENIHQKGIVLFRHLYSPTTVERIIRKIQEDDCYETQIADDGTLYYIGGAEDEHVCLGEIEDVFDYAGVDYFPPDK